MRWWLFIQTLAEGGNRHHPAVSKNRIKVQPDLVCFNTLPIHYRYLHCEPLQVEHRVTLLLIIMLNSDKLSKIQHPPLTMTSQRFSFLLTTIMVIMPINSAFGYYPGMTSQLSAEPSFAQDIVEADMANNTGDAATRNFVQCRQHSKVKTACFHASSSCSFHGCGDDGVTAALLFPLTYGSYRFGHLEKFASSSLSFSPA